jgi:hypothetical protein
MAGLQSWQTALAVGGGGAIDSPAVAPVRRRCSPPGARHRRRDQPPRLCRRSALDREVTIKDEEFLGLLGMLGKRLPGALVSRRRRARGAQGVPGLPRKLRADAKRFTTRGDRTGLQDRRSNGSRHAVGRNLLEHFLLTSALPPKGAALERFRRSVSAGE